MAVRIFLRSAFSSWSVRLRGGQGELAVGWECFVGGGLVYDNFNIGRGEILSFTGEIFKF